MPQTKPVRITLPYLYQELLGAFNWDKGFMYTVKSLALRPGSAIRDYLLTDRSRYFNPVRFLLLTVAIATFLMVEGEFFDQALSNINEYNAGDQKSMAQRQTRFAIYNEYQNVFQPFGVPVFALFSWLFFGGSGYNYAEHLVANAFLSGEVAVVSILTLPVVYYYTEWYPVLFLTSSLYFVWGYVAWLKQKSVWASLARALAALIGASLVYALLVWCFMLLI